MHIQLNTGFQLNMSFRSRKPEEVLLFLLGLFSTWQIVQVAGFSVSTVLTLIFAIYLVITNLLHFKLDGLVLSLFLSAVASTALSLFANIPTGYHREAIVSGIQWILVFIAGLFSTQDKPNSYYTAFFKGFRWSCYAQLIWCIVQVLSSKLLSLDLNILIFRELLRYTGEFSQYRDGVLVCTGLHWHAANLIPILVFVFLCHHSVVLKALCIMVAYFSNNATAMIAMCLCLAFDILLFVKRTMLNRSGAIRRDTAAYGLLGIFALCLMLPVLLPKIMDVVSYLMARIYQIGNPSQGNESSAVHFNYYRFLPNILTNIPVQEALFGSGIDTSGYRFTQFYNQYPESIWTVESDFVNKTLSYGVIGMLLHYGFIGVTTWRLYKTKHTDYAVFLFVLVICGLIYDNQFLWVMLLEFFLYNYAGQHTSP